MLRIETLTVYNCLLAFLDAYDEQKWRGTARQLFNALQPYISRWSYGKLPVNERALAVELKKLGKLPYISLSYRREGKQRARLIYLQKLEHFGSIPLFSSPSSLQVSRRFAHRVKPLVERVAGLQVSKWSTRGKKFCGVLLCNVQDRREPTSWHAAQHEGNALESQGVLSTSLCLRSWSNLVSAC